VTEETKKMVMQNIQFLLNQFIHCALYENVIFCWVLHRQELIDELLLGLDLGDCEVKIISLISDADSLRARLELDVERGIRKTDVVERSLQRLQCYQQMNTIKVDTTRLGVSEVLSKIMSL